MRAEASGLLSKLDARKQLGHLRILHLGLKSGVHPSWIKGSH